MLHWLTTIHVFININYVFLLLTIDFVHLMKNAIFKQQMAWEENPHIVFREIIFELGILYDILLASKRETDI